MPREDPIASGQTRDCEHLHGLICEKRCNDLRRHSRVVERERGDADDAALTIAKRAIRAYKLAHSVAPRPDLRRTVRMRVRADGGHTCTRHWVAPFYVPWGDEVETAPTSGDAEGWPGRPRRDASTVDRAIYSVNST